MNAVNWALVVEISQWFFLAYFFALNLGYLMLNLASLATLRPYIASRALESLPQISSGLQPPISLLVPAYNEETLIVETIQTYLSLPQLKKEIIIVNDGSQIILRKFKSKIQGRCFSHVRSFNDS